MSNFNLEQFEAELRRLQPARPPQTILDRVSADLSARSAPPNPKNAGRDRPSWTWNRALRWLAPAGAVAALCAGLYLKYQAQPPGRPLASSARPVLKADKVEIDQQWVTDFDAVAKLPSGEPVRFRCEQWMDVIRWRDSAKGVVIERATPRVEIVPIRFETY